VEYSISHGREDDEFGKEPYTGFTASLPSPTISTSIPDASNLCIPFTQMDQIPQYW
jgi:hypothetical protein